MRFPSLNPTALKHRIIVCAAAFFILSAMFIFGFVTVYKNCYNSMNEAPMVVFEIATSDGHTEITLLNKTYRFN